ncbi:MAG TPA: FAD-binding oxidoreductase [Candidatus Woesebacteria bacterium]|nr:FAD-binding oxidoreductase [Candidatus Woesebacteria bacterium]
MEVKRLLGRVAYKENLAGDNWLIRIDLGEIVDFIPGQYVSLKVNEEGLRRSYSLASMPGENSIDLMVDTTPMGVGSKYILGLKVGDSVEVLGFLGKFIVNEDDLTEERQLVFVGTGAGVVPLRSMAEDLLANKGFRGQTYFIWGMRYEEDLYWMKEINVLQRDFDNFHFEVVLSKPKNDWPGLSGHVGDIVDKLELDWQNTSVYLCGNPDMISEIEKTVIKKGVKSDRVSYERYA